ncbi:MAG TPA: CpsB/CapC family capsule biosynthesis tyrosine phosphatase [Tepidisphaeraceae bacterium]|nr:CpsB/CapC family capsule biosynthesis tyrosine phosphatase [Tepidisphaeraceae bacterium]
MLQGRIDVHSHLLPGVDDGCQNVADSARCAQTLVKAGYTHAFCTPHVWPKLPENNVQNIRQGVQKLQEEYDRRQIPLRLIPGGEINILWGWPALGDLPGAQVVTYGLAGKYALFDFWAEELSQCIDCMLPAVQHLQSLGLTLILGHPERIAALYRDPKAVDWFAERGVLLQMNTWCLTDPPGSPIYEMAARLLREDRYFTFGTDTHNAASMPNRIRGLKVAEQIVGADKVHQLTVENPRVLLPDEALSERNQAAARAENAQV